MSEFKNYRKKGVQPMRPYVEGEDLIGVSVNKEDTPEIGGMIAVNPDNSEDQWYVGKEFFEKNYEEVVEKLPNVFDEVMAIDSENRQSKRGIYADKEI